MMIVVIVKKFMTIDDNERLRGQPSTRIRVTRNKNYRAKYDQEWQWEKIKQKLLNIHDLQEIEKSLEIGLVKNGGNRD